MGLNRQGVNVRNNWVLRNKNILDECHNCENIELAFLVKEIKKRKKLTVENIYGGKMRIFLQIFGYLLNLCILLQSAESVSITFL